MSKRKTVTFLHEQAPMPTLWVEGTVAERKPVTDDYGDVFHLLDQAIAAARLGLSFRLDFYRGQVSDAVDQDEAHLTVWREVRSDAVIFHREAK